MKKQDIVRRKKIWNLVMGPKGVPDTEANWPTDRRSQNQLKLKLKAAAVSQLLERVPDRTGDKRRQFKMGSAL
jgi:hypothetical protein